MLGKTIWGVTDFPKYENRFAGMTYDQALSAFEHDKPVRILFEQGAAAGLSPGTPEPHFTASFDAWPIPEAKATTWFLQPNGSLAESAPEGATQPAASYTADPSALPKTFFNGKASIWLAGTKYDWQAIPSGIGVGYITAPLTADTVIAGSGSVDLWVQSSSPDTDLEVTVSEVRPDGQEIYVQSGWLRASHRALDTSASTDLRPAHTDLKADAADLPAGTFTPVRVELFPFAHPFRAGSRLRLTVHAPGNDRAVWEFETISKGETVQIAADATHPSKIVLAVVPGVAVPADAPPACGALRGQPCRPYSAAMNGG